MRVFRHRHLLACLAMLVFAMQGLLAFAHTHTHSFPRAGLDRLAARAITYGMCRPGAEKPCQPTAPHNDHGSCQFCWSMAMAGSGVLAVPPVVLPRMAPVEAPAPVRAEPLVGSEATRHFQARAPPLA